MAPFISQASGSRPLTRGQPRPVLTVDLGTTRTCSAFSVNQDGLATSKNVPLEERIKTMTVVNRVLGATNETNFVDTATMYPKTSPGNTNTLYGPQVNDWLHERDEERNGGLIPVMDRQHMHIVRNAKLLLHTSARSQAKVERIKKIAERRGVDPMSFIQDFLNLYYLDLEKYFQKYFPAMLESPPSVVIGCPSAWTDIESETLMVMAQKAGFKNIVIGSEAEGVALFWVTGTKDVLKVGDKLYIADLGGATIDLVMYVIVQLNPLILQELCVAESVLCGGLFLDEKFRGVIKERFFSGQDDDGDIESDLDFAVAKFENWTKKKFSGQGPAFYSLFPLTRIQVQLSGDELRELVFEPAIEEIKKALQTLLDRTKHERQINDCLRVIFSGGLTQNDWITEKIKLLFSTPANQNLGIDVSEVHSAIAPNALGLSLLAGGGTDTVQRRTRKTVGVYNIALHDEAIHGPREDCDAHQNPHVPSEYLVHEIIWVVRYNQLLPEAFEYRKEREMTIGFGVKAMEELIYISESMEAPAGNFTLIPNDNVERNVMQTMGLSRKTVTWSLDGIVKKRNFNKTEDGKYYVVNWELVFRFDNGVLTIQVEVKSKDAEEPLLKTRRTRILLNAKDSGYLSLGSLSTRHEDPERLFLD